MKRPSSLILLPLFSAIVLLGASLLLFNELEKLSKQLPPWPEVSARVRAQMISKATKFYTADHKPFAQIPPINSQQIAYEEFPKHVIDAFISAEDRRFYSHGGISLQSIGRAIWLNLKNIGFVQGGSTITQQLARMYFLGNEKTFSRKGKEVLLAFALERRFSKENILEAYLNTVYLGNNAYGIESAARNYFAKPSKNLNLGEAAMLAGLPKAPSRYAPHKDYKRAKQRQKIILARMHEDGKITAPQLRYWSDKEVVLTRSIPKNQNETGSYFLAQAVRFLERKFEVQDFSSPGYRVTTTMDYDLQKKLEKISGEIGRHLNGKGLKGKHRFETSLLAVQPESGKILAIQGGIDYQISQFNRALWTQRSVGRFDTLLSAAATLSKDYSEPTVNSAYQALQSQNSELLVSQIGFANMRKFLRRLGIRYQNINSKESLGSSISSNLNLTRALTLLVNQGKLPDLFYVEQILNQDGSDVYIKPTSPKPKKLLSSQAAYILFELTKQTMSQPATKGFPTSSSLLLTSMSEDRQNGWIAFVSKPLILTVWIGSEKGRKSLPPDANKPNGVLQKIASYTRQQIIPFASGATSVLPPSGVGFKSFTLSGADGNKSTTNLPVVLRYSNTSRPEKVSSERM